MKKNIGIIGGMGPKATALLQDFILSFLPSDESVNIIIYSNKIPNRTDSIFGTGPSCVPELKNSIDTLETLGSDFLIVPCNQFHFYFPELIKYSKIPIINMIEITAEYISKQYHKPINIGLLATDGTVKSKLYDTWFNKYGFKIITPNEKYQKLTVDAIYKYIKTGNYDKGEELLLEAANHLILEEDVGMIVSGCTEVSIVLNEKNISVMYTDPLTILAKYAVNLALGRNVVK